MPWTALSTSSHADRTSATLCCAPVDMAWMRAFTADLRAGTSVVSADSCFAWTSDLMASAAVLTSESDAHTSPAAGAELLLLVGLDSLGEGAAPELEPSLSEHPASSSATTSAPASRCG